MLGYFIACGHSLDSGVFRGSIGANVVEKGSANGTVKKRDLTGSVAQVTSASIQNQAVMKDPIQALQGKIAGADIVMGNAPGASSTIVIRGYNSITAGNLLDTTSFIFGINASF